MNKPQLSNNMLWMVLGLVGTLTVVALLALVVIALTAARQAAPLPTLIPTLAAQVTVPPVITESPTLTPTATPAPPTFTPTPVEPVIHTVQAGDTLLGIAYQYDVTVQDILYANNMSEGDILSIGQQLVIPVEPPPAPPTPTPTLPLAATGAASGSGYACAANALERSLTLPGDPIQLVLAAGQAYLVANGDLYAAALAELEGSGPLAPSNVIPAGRKLEQYTIRELVDAALDPTTGDLILLDKSDDIYRRTVAGEWKMEFAAAAIPGQYPDPQYLAVQAYGENVYALDADLSRIWKFTPGTALPSPYFAGGDVATGMDLAIPAEGAGNGAIYVLDRSGRALKFVGGKRAGAFGLPAEAGRITWPGQIAAGSEHVLVIDSEGRRVLGLDPVSGQVAWQVTFRFAGMQRLRSAAQAGNTLYALAGRKLYAVKLAATANCPAVSYDNTLYFDGIDLRAVLTGFKLPFVGADLPDRPRSYPGARRLYRFGIHQGVDLYGTDVAGLGVGSPVLAMAAGTVIRADSEYVEMTRQEYDDVIKRTETEHQTPPDLFDKLLGRQVRIAHGFGVESWYAHLSAIPAEIKKDVTVQPGDAIGNVGVSGTSAGAYGTEEGAHLHFELWINGRYLGQGVSLYETMRLWQAIFE